MPNQNPRYAKPVTCAGCSLADLGFGFAMPSGPPKARLTFIGESLGWEEAIAGEAFYGAAGGVLSRICIRAGIDRRQVRIHNIVSCRPPNDALTGMPWEEHAIATCRQYLQPVLDDVPPDGVVVPLGATALASILNLRGVEGVRVQDFHGCVTRSVDDRYWVVPTYHPSYLQRGAMNLLEAVTQDLQLAFKISQQGFRRSPAELVIDPHPSWFRAWVDDHLARVRQDPEGVHLSADTEFAEKAGGADESEVVLGASASPITRVNGGNDRLTGWTVPYREPYRGLVKKLYEGVAEARGWIWMWNKYADLDHLWRDGMAIPNEIVADGMWAWKFLQSDLPRGLGFVAPMASDFGAWKHWGKDRELEGKYAAADGLQNWRTCMWVLSALSRQGMWDLFLNDWHERDVYVLRPAHVEGTPINRQALEQFHVELQAKLGSILTRIKTTAAQGVLKPKLGYSKRPMVKCAACKGTGHDEPQATAEDGDRFSCFVCHGEKRVVATQPPASILGKSKKGGGEAKSAYMLEGVKLVERQIEVEIQICTTCGAEGVTKAHRCKRLPIRSARRKHDAGAVVADRPSRRARSADRRSGPVAAESHQPDESAAVGDGERGEGRSPTAVDRVPVLQSRRQATVRYFWQLPFNPDAPAQVLAYLASQGIEAPVDRKKQRQTTNKKALADLAKQHRSDPFFQLQLDWKAVQKVDSTYAVGSLSKLDSDDRLHPEFLPKPSTFRDSCQNPNLQNVVADKAGPDGLASGFRRCVQARDGVPANRTAAELHQWSERWT